MLQHDVLVLFACINFVFIGFKHWPISGFLRDVAIITWFVHIKMPSGSEKKVSPLSHAKNCLPLPPEANKKGCTPLPTNEPNLTLPNNQTWPSVLQCPNLIKPNLT